LPIYAAGAYLQKSMSRRVRVYLALEGAGADSCTTGAHGSRLRAGLPGRGWDPLPPVPVVGAEAKVLGTGVRYSSHPLQGRRPVQAKVPPDDL